MYTFKGRPKEHAGFTRRCIVEALWGHEKLSVSARCYGCLSQAFWNTSRCLFSSACILFPQVFHFVVEERLVLGSRPQRAQNIGTCLGGIFFFLLRWLAFLIVHTEAQISAVTVVGDAQGRKTGRGACALRTWTYWATHAITAHAHSRCLRGGGWRRHPSSSNTHTARRGQRQANQMQRAFVFARAAPLVSHRRWVWCQRMDPLGCIMGSELRSTALHAYMT